MAGLKRISMAGSDVAVTDATIAKLVLEYAMHLGRAGTTDIVAVPAPDHDQGIEVDLLIGPASEIVISDSSEGGTLSEEKVLHTIADLRSRIERTTGRVGEEIAGDEQLDPLEAFPDFDDYRDQS